MEVDELTEKVKYKREFKQHMKGMSNLKLNHMVDILHEKLGFINRKTSTEKKIRQLCEELYEASCEKK